MKVAFIGSGSVARALGALLHGAGHEVSFSSRDGAAPAFGRAVSLDEAATQAEIVILAVPFVATREVLPALAGALAGKLVIDATNPVNADWSPMLLGQENSAGEEVARRLPASRVVKAFNTVFADVMRADRLAAGGRRVTCFVASDDEAATAAVVDLARSIGFAPRAVGPLSMARHLEAMAHLNIQIAVGMKGGTGAAFFYDRVAE
jgi:8-hydroxy-5-deazaflavin:NADPH oxidoreductase